MAKNLHTPEVEEWRVYPANPKYLVSNLGRVQGPRRLLAQYTTRNGYLYVNITVGRKTRSHLAHRMVMLSFKGSAPSGYQVHHRNNDKSDNRLANLEYVTPAENSRAKHGHGTMPMGETGGNSKLKNEQVLAIRAAYDQGQSAQGIGRRFGVSGTQVLNIGKRRQWTHI